MTVGESFIIEPSLELVLWTVVAVSLAVPLIAAGVVAAMKGQWLWVVLGLLSGGVLFLVGAFMPPAPGSMMRRTSRRLRVGSTSSQRCDDPLEPVTAREFESRLQH